MHTEKQRDASRTNGSKSQGPTTPEGKAISSRNGVTHGLCGRDVVLGNENPELWQAVRNAFTNHWQPANEMEVLMVDELAATHWKLMRAESIETATLNFEMDVLREEIEKTFKRVDEQTRQAVAFKSLADQSKTLAALDRQQTRLQRQFQRTWKLLGELVKSRPPESAEAADQPEQAKSAPVQPIPAQPAKSPRTADQPQPMEDDKPPCRAA